MSLMSSIDDSYVYNSGAIGAEVGHAVGGQTQDASNKHNKHGQAQVWQTEGFSWDDLRKIFTESLQMAKVPNGVETLPKISIAWVVRMNVTDNRQTDGR